MYKFKVIQESITDYNKIRNNPSVHQQRTKLWYILTLEYLAAIKEKIEEDSFVLIWQHFYDNLNEKHEMYYRTHDILPFVEERVEIITYIHMCLYT